jgi:hypothetical protein
MSTTTTHISNQKRTGTLNGSTVAAAFAAAVTRSPAS